MSGLCLGLCVPILKFAPLTILELLAFKAQKFTGSRDPGHAPFTPFDIQGLAGIPLVDFHPNERELLSCMVPVSRSMCQISSKSVKNCDCESAGTHTRVCDSPTHFCVCVPALGHRTPDIGHRTLDIGHVKWFLQRVSIACYAERCISYSKSVRPSVRPSVTRWHCVKTTQATIMASSLEDSPMTLVSSRLTSVRNSKGNIGSEGAEWKRGSKNVAKIGNFSQ